MIDETAAEFPGDRPAEAVAVLLNRNVDVRASVPEQEVAHRAADQERTRPASARQRAEPTQQPVVGPVTESKGSHSIP